MSDVYKVAVALSMTSNAPAFLSALSSKLLHVHTQVKDLEGGLTRLSKIKLAIGGGLAIAGGAATLSVLGKMVDKGNELVKVQQNMAQAGVKAAEVQEAYAKAWELTNKYRNVSAAEALKVINEGRMTFGSQADATHHSEEFIKMISFLKAYQGGKHGGNAAGFESEAIAAMKSGEIAGKITPQEMAEHVKQLTAMRVAYGEQLKITQYLAAQRAGGVALRNTSDDFRYGMFPALVQENGVSAGTMLMTAFNKVVAGTGNRTQSIAHMAELGILNKDQVKYDTTGRAIGLKDPSGILNNTEAAMNFGDWVMKTLRPRLDAQLDREGVTGAQRGVRESQLISAMFPDRNAAKAITEVLQQFSKLSKDAAMMREARASMNEGAYLDKSYEGQKQAFHEQWENFVQALGAPMVGTATEALRSINSALAGMAQWAARPEMAGAVEMLGKGIAVLGTSLVGAGATALLAAIGPAGWIAAGITGLVGAAEIADPGHFKKLFDDYKAIFSDLGKLDFAATFKDLRKLINDGLFGLLDTQYIKTIAADLKQIFADMKAFNFSAMAKDIGKYFNDALAGLPAMVGSAITEAIGKIAEEFKSAIKNMLSGGILGGGRPTGQMPSGLPIDPSAYRGAGIDPSMIHRASLGGEENGSAGSATGPLADAVYSGVSRAFREMMGMGSGSGSGSAGSMFQNASFSTGGGANDNSGGGSFGGASGGASSVGRALRRSGAVGAGGANLGALGANVGYSGNDGRRAAGTGFTAAGRANVASWLGFLRHDMGLGLDQARGVVAMMQGESGLNLNPAAAGDHNRAGVPQSFGTVQWNVGAGRFQKLLALARQLGKPWQDRGVQQQFFKQEMLGRYNSVWRRILASPHGDAALALGIAGYENPQKHGLAFQIRRPFLNRLRRDGTTGAPPERQEAPPTAGPPPRQKEETHIHNVYMDGEKIERHVTRRQVAKARFPTGFGGVDTHGNWHGPGSTGSKVA